MIVRVTFNDGLCMLFGSSYKPWTMQLDEWLWMKRRQNALPEKILSIESSSSLWIAWGGLKWCLESNFQKELNREECQAGDPNRRNPRQYSKIKFKIVPITVIKVERMFAECRKDI